MAQLININSTEFRRCNLSAIQSGGTWEGLIPDENEIILISTENALTAGGSGNCDAYIVGDGTTAATALPLHWIDNYKGDSLDDVFDSLLGSEGGTQTNTEDVNIASNWGVGTLATPIPSGAIITSIKKDGVEMDTTAYAKFDKGDGTYQSMQLVTSNPLPYTIPEGLTLISLSEPNKGLYTFTYTTTTPSVEGRIPAIEESVEDIDESVDTLEDKFKNLTNSLELSESFYISNSNRGGVFIPIELFGDENVVTIKLLDNTYKYGIIYRTERVISSGATWDSGWQTGDYTFVVKEHLLSSTKYISIMLTDVATASYAPTYSEVVSALDINVNGELQNIDKRIDVLETTPPVIKNITNDIILDSSMYYGTNNRGNIFIPVELFGDKNFVRIYGKTDTYKYVVTLRTERNMGQNIVWDSGWTGTSYNNKELCFYLSEHLTDAVKYMCISVTDNSTAQYAPTFSEIIENIGFEVYGEIDTIKKAATYDGEIITINGWNKFRLFSVARHSISSGKYMQGSAVYNDVLFIFNIDGANVAAYNFKTGDLYGTTEVSALNGSHCNNCAWSNEFYDVSDEFPLLWVSDGNYEGDTIRVVRITRSSDTFSYSVVQTITLPSLNDLPNAYSKQAVLDTANGVAYMLGTKRNTWYSAEDNEISVYRFAMPKLNDGDVAIAAGDVVKLFEVEGVVAPQGFCYHGGKIYLSSGFSQTSSYPNTGLLQVISIDKQAYVSKVQLKDANLLEEPEACFIYNNELYITGQASLFRLAF